MRVKILESAVDDLRAGYSFYEAQEHGVGDYFINTLFSEIDSLSLYGGIHRTSCGYHRLLSHKFPFAIYYRMDGDTVVVRAVLDCRRDPAWIRRRLR